jgi:hypothetical protein
VDTIVVQPVQKIEPSSAIFSIVGELGAKYMALFLRMVVCLCLAGFVFLPSPVCAEPPTASEKSKEATSNTTENAAKPENAYEPAKASGTEKVSGTEKSSGTEDASEAENASEADKATQSLIKDLSDPSKKKEALGWVAELLGVCSALMLITGAILAACVKKWGLVKLMLAVGVIGGIAAVAAPGIIILTGSEPLGYAFAMFYFLMYIGSFFLPTLLALKGNTSKKWIILVINAAGFIVPGAGLVALFLALKDKPANTAEVPAG